jgi:hypothetical protein
VFEIVVSLLYQNAPRYENRTRLSWEHPNPLRHLFYFSSRDAINLFVWASTSPLTAAILALGFASGVAPFLLLLHSFSTCTCYLGIHYGPLPTLRTFLHARTFACVTFPSAFPPATYATHSRTRFRTLAHPSCLRVIFGPTLLPYLAFLLSLSTHTCNSVLSLCCHCLLCVLILLPHSRSLTPPPILTPLASHPGSSLPPSLPLRLPCSLPLT